MEYDNKRDNFDKLVKKYREYQDLYKLFNGGSLEGCTTFSEFYWRFSFYIKYDDPQRIGSTGY